MRKTEKATINTSMDFVLFPYYVFIKSSSVTVAVVMWIFVDQRWLVVVAVVVSVRSIRYGLFHVLKIVCV